MKGRGISNRSSPCLNCADRHPHCHADCEQYASYRVNCQKELKARYKAKEEEYIYFEAIKRTKKQR